MRGLLVLIAGGLGAGAFWRRKRRAPALTVGSAEPQAEALGVDPAAELRAKLAESKADASTADAAPIAVLEERSPLDPQSRRQDTHDRARAAIDELG